MLLPSTGSMAGLLATCKMACANTHLPGLLFLSLQQATASPHLHRKLTSRSSSVSCVPEASVRNPARDKVMRKEADIRKACSDFRDPSGNS